jgi:hypothetical protein
MVWMLCFPPRQSTRSGVRDKPESGWDGSLHGNRLAAESGHGLGRRTAITVTPIHSPVLHRLYIQPARNYPRQSPRSRPLYALLVVLVIAAGLLWRSRFMPLPPFASKYGGDALWALVVFFGFGFLFRGISTLRLAVIALCFAWAVEFSQLYHGHWIDMIRVTRLGKLVLGSTFNWPDLAAYAFGIMLGVLMESGFRKARQ